MIDYASRLIEICDLLPPYCLDYFYATAEIYEIRTRCAYAGDLKVFFEYVLGLPCCAEYSSIREIPLTVFEEITSTDIDKYMIYLGKYEINGEIYENSLAGKKRKLASLKAFINHYRKIGKIKNNPTEFTYTPKVKKKEILILSQKEQQKLKDAIDMGVGKTDQQKLYHEKTKYRDRAILSMFLGTGLRVSELVSLDNYDVDLEQQRLTVVRKGGDTAYVYFNKEVLHTLCDYLDLERNTLLQYDEKTLNGDMLPDGPLFVSLRHDRISVRMVQTLISRYARFVLPPKTKVSPHTLRRTFGSELYRQYLDLALVQHALGHSSPETTKAHYVNYDDEYNKRIRDFDYGKK